jgi:hypothetical protein
MPLLRSSKFGGTAAGAGITAAGAGTAAGMAAGAGTVAGAGTEAGAGVAASGVTGTLMLAAVGIGNTTRRSLKARNARALRVTLGATTPGHADSQLHHASQPRSRLATERQTTVFTVRQRAAVTLGSRLRRPTIYSSAISRRFSEVSVAFTATRPVSSMSTLSSSRRCRSLTQNLAPEAHGFAPLRSAGR